MYHFVSDQQNSELNLGDTEQVSSDTTQYLKKFQIEAIQYMYEKLKHNKFCVLNDESRLGKCASIVALLSAVGANKKTLLIVQNDKQYVVGWNFHFSVLTRLSVSIIENSENTTESPYNIYIATWSTLRNICDLSKFNFDYVIVDHRGFTLNNNFCTSILFKYFENKVNILVSSVDITSDLKLLYNVLRLGGRLDARYKSFNKFQEKYQLPEAKEVLSKKVDLEEYFKKREILGEFVKDFRLRRYCYQYEDISLKNISVDQYKKNLALWQASNLDCCITISSDISTDSTIDLHCTAGTDEIIECLMKIKHEREIAADSNPLHECLEVIELNDEPIYMSPLIFETSDSDNDIDDKQQCDRAVNSDKEVYKNNAVTISNRNKERTKKERDTIQLEKSKKNIANRTCRKSSSKVAVSNKPSELQTLSQNTLKSPQGRQRQQSSSTKEIDGKAGIADTQIQEPAIQSMNKKKEAHAKNIRDMHANKKRQNVATNTASTSKQILINKRKYVINLQNQKMINPIGTSTLQLKEATPKRITRQANKKKSPMKEEKTPTKTENTTPKSSSKAKYSKDTFRKLKEAAFTPTGVHGRVTRSMQRITRSASHKYSKYMRRNIFLLYDKSPEQKRKSKLKAPKIEEIEQPVQDNHSEVKEPKEGNKSLTPTNHLPVLSGSSNSDYNELQYSQNMYNVQTEESDNHLSGRCPMSANPASIPLFQLPMSLNMSNEIIVVNSISPDVISLSSQDEGSTYSTTSRRTLALKRTKAQINDELLGNQTDPRINNKSPDLFSNSSDVPLTLTQLPFEGFKIFGSEVRKFRESRDQDQSTKVHQVKNRRERSCLELLEKMFEPHKKSPQAVAGASTSAEVAASIIARTNKKTRVSPTYPNNCPRTADDDIFDITNNTEFGSRLRLTSSGDISPLQQQQPQQQQQRSMQNNKITNYLIPSNSTEVAVTQNVDVEVTLPTTPSNRIGIGTGTSSVVRKSPKFQKSVQTTKLTRWFAATTESNSVTKPSISAPTTLAANAQSALNEITRLSRHSGGPSNRRSLELNNNNWNK